MKAVHKLFACLSIAVVAMTAAAPAQAVIFGNGDVLIVIFEDGSVLI